MKKKKDDNGLDYGFRFSHKKKRRLGKSCELDILDLVRLSVAYPDSGNDQNIFIYCEDCNTYMTYMIGKSDDLSGYFICPICKSKVRESTPYHQLEKENEEFLKNNKLDGYSDDDYDEFYN